MTLIKSFLKKILRNTYKYSKKMLFSVLFLTFVTGENKSFNLKLEGNHIKCIEKSSANSITQAKTSINNQFISLR